MAQNIVSVQGIGKNYKLGGPKGFNTRDRLVDNVRRMMSRDSGDFWAVRDISFELGQGEALGVIGRNGAGKSTLLKILSRITIPSEGRFTIEGRVSSLLEVGTGFHLDLTGRENIFLNGTILGMRRAEVRRKFDEILEFSGVEPFIDTPVKHYSNGQRVRLAFAVAAHLEPEVLIIDEVLAVGDVEFQRKCIGKMKDVTGHGRTILFVSHNMSAISSLCNRSLLLDGGRVEDIGPTAHIISQYLNKNNAGSVGVKDLTGAPYSGDGVARVTRIRLKDTDGNTIDHMSVTRSFGIEIDFDVMKEGSQPQPSVMVHSSAGEPIFSTYPVKKNDRSIPKGSYSATCWFPPDMFNEDTYYFSVRLLTWVPAQSHEAIENVVNIAMIDDLNSVTRAPTYAVAQGMLRPRMDWEMNI